MPRDRYITVFLAFIVGMPLFLVFLPDAIVGYGDKNLNIPDREYWLAPERREPTTAFVRMYCRSLAAAVAIFMAYVHWLVVRANALQPAEISPVDIGAAWQSSSCSWRPGSSFSLYGFAVTSDGSRFSSTKE